MRYRASGFAAIISSRVIGRCRCSRCPAGLAAEYDVAPPSRTADPTVLPRAPRRGRLRAVAVFGAPSAKDGVSLLVVRARSRSFRTLHLRLQIRSDGINAPQPLATCCAAPAKRHAFNQTKRVQLVEQ